MKASGGAPPPEWLRAEAQRLYGQDPVGYETGRPEYPERIYELLISRCDLKSGTKVVEIGPGTGRATRRLLERGARVTAVEPDPTLAKHLRETFAGRPVDVLTGPFEDVPLPSEEFELAVAAMSFHWVAQERGLPKLGHILRPGGWVAIWWTVFGDPTRPDPFADATRSLLGEGTGPEREPGPPQFELDADQRRLDLERRAGLVDAESELVRWTARLTAPELRDLYSSMIRVLRRPQHERDRILDELVAIAHEDFGGVVERPFMTAMYTARRP